MMNFPNQIEPKKRELTQKIPQKNTLPNDDKSTTTANASETMENH